MSKKMNKQNDKDKALKDRPEDKDNTSDARKENPSSGSGKGSKNSKKQKSRKGNPKDNQDRPIGRKDYTESAKKAGRLTKQDPFFYAVDETAIKNMASFPFLETLGDPVGQNDVVPFVLVSIYDHHISANNTITSNVATRAANAFFEQITQGYTGGDVSFEAPDLLMAELAAASLLAVLEEGRRAYGLMRYFLQFNAGYARRIVQAAGFDFDDLKAKMADFRTEFNIHVSQFNKQIALPQAFMLGQRWKYLATHVFTDTEDPDYATAFMWKLEGAMKYDPITATTGTSLTRSDITPIKETGWMVEEYFQLVDELMDALVDSDTRKMFGAIRRVYDQASLETISEIEMDYTTELTVNDVVSAQLHNSSAPGTAIRYWAPSSIVADTTANQKIMVYQDQSGHVYSNVGYPTPAQGTYTEDYEETDVIVDMYDHLVTPGNVLDITATVQFGYETGGPAGVNDKSYTRLICRSELIRAFRLILDPSAANSIGLSSYIYDIDARASTQGLLDNPIIETRQISLLSKIDSHPWFRVFNASSGKRVMSIGEFDKYTMIGKLQMKKLHDQTMFQMLAMPLYNKSVTK